MPRQARIPRRRLSDINDDLDRAATADMTAEELEEHRLHQLNDKAARLVTFGAFELEDAGANGYASGVRLEIFTALGVLAELRQPELAGDLTKVQAYCAELIDEIEKPTPTAA
jgi:hypothetical protein